MRGHIHRIALSFALIVGFTLPTEARVVLPSVFGDHMVLQQNSKLAVWGWARPLEEVTVTGSWDHKTVRAKADSHANWRVMLDTPSAGGPYTLAVLGSNTIVLEDVLVGGGMAVLGSVEHGMVRAIGDR